MTLIDTCHLCHPKRGVIARGQYWTLVLNENQTLLGRCYVTLNRHETDMTHLSQREQTMLFEWMRRAKRALGQVFAPDHFNYVMLMNMNAHVHAHIIPRYAEKREFDGQTFTDEKFGDHLDWSAEQFLSDAGFEQLTSNLTAALKDATGGVIAV